jgi:hypothetical protein
MMKEDQEYTEIEQGALSGSTLARKGAAGSGDSGRGSQRGAVSGRGSQRGAETDLMGGLVKPTENGHEWWKTRHRETTV